MEHDSPLQKAFYRGVPIQWVLDALTGQFVAHFELPTRKDKGFQSVVRKEMRPYGPGPHRLARVGASEALQAAKAAIDAYLDDEP